MKLKDSIWIGIICGLIAPSIGMAIFYYTNFSQESFQAFIDLTIEGKILSPLLSLCAVINLGVFYLFIHFENYNTARGIILSTLLYGIVIVVLKFVL